MTRILTVSGIGISGKEFFNQVRDLFEEDSNRSVHQITWQIERGPQMLMDLLDTRDGKEVISKVAEQLIHHIEEAHDAEENLIILSVREGSRIAEEGLSMIKGFDKITIDVKHIMLAPDIDGSDWRSIGKYAGAAALLGLAGLTLAATRSKRGLASAALGVIGSAMIANKSTIGDRLNLKDGEDDAKFVEMDRYIFLNPENEEFDKISEFLFDGTYYKGAYELAEIASLEPEHMMQEFRFQKWMRQHHKPKGEILADLLHR